MIRTHQSTGRDGPILRYPSEPVRWRFDTAYKARILRESDQLTEPGQLLALL